MNTKISWQIRILFLWVIFTVSICTAADPVATIRFDKNSEWKPVDMTDVRVKAGSALDLSSVWGLSKSHVVRETKRPPRLVVGSTGRLEAEDEPGVPVRLIGSTFQGLRFFPEKEDVDLFAKLCRRQGHNILRLMNLDQLCPQKEREIDPDILDRMDYLLFRLGEEGIYVHMVAFSYAYNFPRERWYRTNPNTNLRMYLGDEVIRESWAFLVDTLMNHVNPYTGIAWKDDPAIACIEFFNEQEFGFRNISSREPDTLAALNLRYRAWLEAKYDSAAALARAWNAPEIAAFSQARAPDAGTSDRGPSSLDFIEFCSVLSRECASWCESTLRKAGYQGLTGQYNLPLWFGATVVRYEVSQIAIRNTYFHHPTNQSNPGSLFYKGSSIADVGGYWRATNSSRFADRPFFVTEYNHPMGNPYQHEMGILFHAYSALQGFDVLIAHAGGVVLNVSGPIEAWSIGSSPVGRANSLLSAFLFLRGDVKTSTHRVNLAIKDSWLKAGYGAISGEQDKLALLCGFALSFPEMQSAGQGIPAPADLTISPAGGADVKAADWSADVVESGKSPKMLSTLIAGLVEGGILPKGNVTDVEQGIFQSDTGEILMRCRENLLKVVTPLTEAIAMEAGVEEELGVLRVRETSVPATVAACSLDGTTLEKSKRILLIYSTQVVNTGMSFREAQDGRLELVNLGTAPVLMRCGRLSAILKREEASALNLYALGFDGTRREKIPVNFENGKIDLKIDTSLLENGPVTFFELSSE